MAFGTGAAARNAMVVLTGLVAAVALATEPTGFTQMSSQATVHVPQGTYLDADPEVYTKLHPDPEDPQAAHLNISLVTGEVILETDEGIFTYHGYMYKDNKDGSVHTFGPTMRFSPPAHPTVDFYNELTLPLTPDFPETTNAWRDTTYTNLHQHGWWAYHGVSHIVEDQPYTGGDNVFFELGPKKNVTDAPSYNHYNYTIGPYHLPGNYWYHPHKHQATALQTQTAAGNSIIDGDGTFLVSARGCDTILGMLLTAQERIVMIQALFFQPSLPDNTSSGNLQSMYDNPGYQQIAENSNTGDPVCCNETRTGYEYNMTSQNFPLINGIYQPIITLQAGVYQRWRMLYAGFKFWVDLTILYEDSDELAPCDLQLISKDGIYIMDLPRTIEHVALAAANRAEVLIKCNGTVGDRYRLAAGQYPSFGPDWNITSDGTHFNVPNMATIELTDPTGADPSLMIDLDVPEQQKACTPLRPSYVADLRDEVIQERGIHPLRQQLNAQNEVLKGGCSLNGRNWTFPTDVTNPPMVMQMGATVEIQYENDQYHPVHLHESPQQITSLDMRGLYNKGLNISWTSYFEVGDWYDTVRIPNLADPAHFLNDTTTTTRLQPGPFSGYSVIHCHYLMHEDRGCMKVVQWRCPDTNPGPNGSIPYPCPGGFTFGVGGDFVQENELYYGIPQFGPPPPNPFIVPAPAPAPVAPAGARSATAGNASTTAGRRLMTSSTSTEHVPVPAPALAPLAVPMVLQDDYSEDFDWSLPNCTCTDVDIFTGQQYCFRLGANGAADAQCQYCTELSFPDEACQRSGNLPGSIHPSPYYFCSEIVELPVGLQVQGQSLSANSLGLSCTNVFYDPHPYPLAPPVTPGAPTCTCKDAGPGWGVTGSVICWTLVNDSIPDTNCVPPAEYNVCSVQLPIISIGNMADGSGKVCKATGGGAGVSPAASLGPSSSTIG